MDTSVLATEVYAGFSKKYRDQLTTERIAGILAEYDLSDKHDDRPTPRLRSACEKAITRPLSTMTSHLHPGLT
jgi:hypothetical protein